MTLSGPVLSPDDCSCFVFPPGDFLLPCSSSSSPLHRVASTNTTSTTPRVRFLHPRSRDSDDEDDDDDADSMLAFPKSSKKVPKKGSGGSAQMPFASQTLGGAATVDPYQVLQIRRDATASEIRHAYMRLALWHHPGRTTLGSLTPQEKARRRQVFEVLAACYETLIDKATRARCDALLRETEPTPPPAPSAAPSSGPGGNGGEATTPPRSGHRRIKRRMLVGRLLLPSESHDSHHSRHGTVMPSLSSVSLDSCSTDSTRSSVDEDEEHGGGGFGMTTTNGTSTHHQSPTPGNGYDMDKVDSRGDRSLRSLRSHSSIQQQRTARHQQPPRFAQTLHQLLCGAHSISVADDDEDGAHVVDTAGGKLGGVATSHHRRTAPSPAAVSSASSSSSERHFSERETNRLFGGPLFLLFRARRWKPLTDPYRVFADVFGTDLNGSNGRPLPSLRALQPTSPAAAVPVRPSAAWTGSSERQSLPDGTHALVCTTTRVWPDRVLIRTETIRANGRRQITVTSEPRLHPDSNDPAWSSSSPLALCGTCDFQLCLWE